MISKAFLLLVLTAGARNALLVRADEPDIDEPDIDDEPSAEDVDVGTVHVASGCTEIKDSPDPEDDDYFQFYQHDSRLDPNNFVRVVYKVRVVCFAHDLK